MARALMALWCAFLGFIASLFRRPPPAAPLPVPVTAKASAKPDTRPTSGSVRATHQRTSSAWVKEPSPLKRSTSAAAPSPVSSTARGRARSPTTPFHPPPSPFPTISLSGIFATPPSSPPVPRSHSSCRTLDSRSSSAVMQPDRSALSPATMSDGSFDVVSLSPVTVARLPSPWSPVGKVAPSDVWLSVDGLLMNATGPVLDRSSQTTPLSRISTASLYSASSALDAFGISVFVRLDDQHDDVDTSTTIPRLTLVRDENPATVVSPGPHTPRKRRGTLSCITPHTTGRATKRLTTPLTTLDNTTHVRSATSNSMAYELRMGFYADGRNVTTLENIISLLDQASPEATRPHEDAMPPVVVG